MNSRRGGENRAKLEPRPKQGHHTTPQPHGLTPSVAALRAKPEERSKTMEEYMELYRRDETVVDHDQVMEEVRYELEAYDA